MVWVTLFLLMVFIVKKHFFMVTKLVNSGFVVSELVVGSGEQDIWINSIFVYSRLMSKPNTILSCSPDPTANSKVKNPSFHKIFDQLKQLLLVLMFYSQQKQSNWWKKNHEKSELLSELVVGSNEQDIWVHKYFIFR